MVHFCWREIYSCTGAAASKSTRGITVLCLRSSFLHNFPADAGPLWSPFGVNFMLLLTCALLLTGWRPPLSACAADWREWVCWLNSGARLQDNCRKLWISRNFSFSKKPSTYTPMPAATWPPPPKKLPLPRHCLVHSSSPVISSQNRILPHLSSGPTWTTVACSVCLILMGCGRLPALWRIDSPTPTHLLSQRSWFGCCRHFGGADVCVAPRVCVYALCWRGRQRVWVIATPLRCCFHGYHTPTSPPPHPPLSCTHSLDKDQASAASTCVSEGVCMWGEV